MPRQEDFSAANQIQRSSCKAATKSSKLASIAQSTPLLLYSIIMAGSSSSLLWSMIAVALLPCVFTNAAEMMTHHHPVNNNNDIGKFTSSSLHNGNSLIQSTSAISDDILLSDSSSRPLQSSTIQRRYHRMIASASSGLASKIPFVRGQKLHHRHYLSSHNKVALQSPLFANIDHYQILTKLRGGGGDDATEYDDEASSSEEEEYDDEYDEEYDSEYDSTDDESEEEEEDNIVTSLTSSSLKSSIRSKSSPSSSSTTKQQQIQEVQYDEVLSPPSMQQLIISLGVMFLSQRIDILDTRTVRIARMAFVTYIIVMQIFLLYVRVKAKMVNDRTEITLSNPLASLVEGAAASAGGGGGGAGGVGGGGGNFMVKALANQMLSTTTTIYEYDLQQAKKMNSGLLMPMIFLYFLHFKMKQVQPLLMQTATGVMNMVYSPLFQVYVLGRNLERPFKLTSPGSNSAMLDRMEAMRKENEEEGESGTANDHGDEGEGEKEEEEDGDYSEEEESDEEEEEEEEEEESEYDSYEEEEE
jgi:hypothetical protein